MRAAIACALATCLCGSSAWADASSATSGKSALSETDGANIYQHVCQGCHMANAGGATGAGTIPALANNAKLQATGYPVYVVLNGLGGMPVVGSSLDDNQVAAVVNFVTTHFGNHAADKLTADQVRSMRPPKSYTTPSE